MVRRLLRLLPALLLAGASAKALAGSADLEGRLAYRIAGDHITVEIERISNNTSDTTTGRLYITVWMTVDSNLRTRGYRVARLRIIGSSDGTLKPGQYFSDLGWTLAYQAPPPGTYYIHFYTSQDPETNTVSDSHTFTSTVEVGRSDDHGNSRDSARNVKPPNPTLGVIDPGNDTDYFQFAVSARGAVVMESSGSLDTIGTLFDSEGRRVEQDDDDAGYPNFRIERTLDAGTYYVRVHSYQTATGGYTLHLRTRGEGGGDDHGNSHSSATLVSLPNDIVGTVEPGNDTDYFQFAISARGAVVMESSGRLDTVGTLFDARGNRIVQDDDGAGYPNFRIEQTLDAGTYSIRVHSFWTTAGDYTLHLCVGQSDGLASRPMSAFRLDEGKIPVTEVTMTDDKPATLLTIPRRSGQIAPRPPCPCDSADGGGNSRRTHRRCAPPLSCSPC